MSEDTINPVYKLMMEILQLVLTCSNFEHRSFTR